jgi:hypothetical protein
MTVHTRTSPAERFPDKEDVGVLHPQIQPSGFIRTICPRGGGRG